MSKRKLLAFAGSNSKNSINKKLVTYAAGLMDGFETEILDLNDYEMPVYGIDKEKDGGIPQKAHEFLGKVKGADLIFLSLAEHNGTFTVAFKNLLDWCSRIPDETVFQSKPMFLMATSPGKRGGQGVLGAGENRLPRNGAEVLSTFSLPQFNDNFDSEKGVVDEESKNLLNKAISKLKDCL